MTRAPKPIVATEPTSPGAERSRRLRRIFKRLILAVTVVAVAAILGGTSVGRHATARLWIRAKGSVRGVIGLPPDRADADADWRAKRANGIEQTGRVYRDFFEKEAGPAWRRILTEAGMSPEAAILRWANYDRTVVLSSKVFEADDTGRAYRMRPKTRAFWSQKHVLPHGLSSFFFLPDTPEVRRSMAEARELAMPESFQTTNSWGCRGPEPDPSAKARGLVVGDSFMQGLFVADDQTPPECLARSLREAWKVPVSILNTGHIGYSPEQYYHTMVEYFDRFLPHFVILSVCPNDFGDAGSVLVGKADWAEGAYWLGEIEQYCRTRQVPCLLVPIPFESQVTGKGDQGNYPGPLASVAGANSSQYLNPVEAFIDEHLRLIKIATLLGKRPATSPLFNGHLDDGHFSPQGTALWGKLVARRVALIHDPQDRPAASAPSR